MAPLVPNREIAVPFHFGPDGGVATVSTPYEAAIGHLKSLILTRYLERVMRPTYGTPAKDTVFEVNDDLRTADLAVKIQQAVSRWEPDINVVSVESVEDEQRTGTMALIVMFKLRPREDILTATVQIGGSLTGTTHG